MEFMFSRQHTMRSGLPSGIHKPSSLSVDSSAEPISNKAAAALQLLAASRPPRISFMRPGAKSGAAFSGKRTSTLRAGLHEHDAMLALNGAAARAGNFER